MRAHMALMLPWLFAFILSCEIPKLQLTSAFGAAGG